MGDEDNDEYDDKYYDAIDANNDGDDVDCKDPVYDDAIEPPLVRLWPPRVLPQPQPKLSRLWQEDQQEQGRGGGHATLPLRPPWPAYLLSK